MKKSIKSLLLVLAIGTSLGVAGVAANHNSLLTSSPVVAKAAETENKQVSVVKLAFPDDGNEGSSQYNETWIAKSGDYEFSIVNGSNYNRAWSYVGFGRKKDATKGEIKTKTSIEASISSIELDFQFKINTYNMSNINSFCIEVSDTADFAETTKIEIDEKTSGKHSFTIEKPAKNKYYRLYIDAKAMGDNAAIQIKSLEFFTTPEEPTKPTITEDAFKDTTLTSNLAFTYTKSGDETVTYSDFKNFELQFKLEFDFSKYDGVIESGIYVTDDGRYEFMTGGSFDDNEQNYMDDYLNDNTHGHKFVNSENKSKYIVGVAIDELNITTALTDFLACPYYKCLDSKGVASYYFANSFKRVSISSMVESYLKLDSLSEDQTTVLTSLKTAIINLDA